MDNFSAGQAHDASLDHAGPGAAVPFELLDGDDNLGDEAPFPTTWQHLARVDSPND